MINPDAAGRPKPLSAVNLQHLLEDANPPRIVDVREDQELAVAAFPGDVLHLPLSAADRWMDDLLDQFNGDQDVVVVCHAGVRSWQFGCWLLAQRPELTVWNLDGGIDAWSQQVDPGVPRY
ncbi:rhodanese-like domain-containing protein [Synechococcus sp. UW105]|uniref:rhodanese-like domain-containing protein n=1 Tax=Synechococcus sp. UW105 TaxID=337067 RepID=UPI000E0E5898|nr:rhodanese-like domain-containing protein [Synechococcus sp. UW105]